MYIELDRMPLSARVWIYQASRNLKDAEIEYIQNRLPQFLTQWTAHQQALEASGEVFHQRFLLLSVNEGYNAASGCSIDASVHFVQELGKALNIDWFDRQQVIFEQEDQSLTSIPLQEIKNKIAQGEIKPQTPTFNNLVATLGEFKEKWKQSAQDTWLARYF